MSSFPAQGQGSHGPWGRGGGGGVESLEWGFLSVPLPVAHLALGYGEG